jgi:hypothetical protein
VSIGVHDYDFANCAVPFLQIVEMSKILPLATPHSLRASFASLMLSDFIHQYPFIPIRPALASSAFSISQVWKTVMRRSEIGVRNPANVLLQAMGIWVDSALGKGKHGRGKGMSGDAYGRLAGKRMEAPETAAPPKWGEGVMGQRALAEYEQSTQPSQHQGDHDEAEREKNQAQPFIRLPSGFGTDVGSHSEEDEVNLMVWLAKRK